LTSIAPIRIGLNKYSSFGMEMPPARVRGSIHPSLEETGEISLPGEGSFWLHSFLAWKCIKDETEESGVPVLKQMLSRTHGEESNSILPKRNLKKFRG